MSELSSVLTKILVDDSSAFCALVAIFVRKLSELGQRIIWSAKSHRFLDSGGYNPACIAHFPVPLGYVDAVFEPFILRTGDLELQVRSQVSHSSVEKQLEKTTVAHPVGRHAYFDSVSHWTPTSLMLLSAQMTEWFNRHSKLSESFEERLAG